MILKQYLELNKTVAQINALYPDGYNANCYYGKRCKRYTIPIDIIKAQELHWFAYVESRVESFKIYSVKCGGAIVEIDKNYHILGTDGNGQQYLTWKGLTSLPHDIFQIWIEVKYTNGNIRSFFTEEYEVDLCDTSDILYSCYNKEDNGGFDGNSTWIGLPNNPYSIDGTGNVNLRYFNNYTLRDLKVLYSGKQKTFTAFNNRAVRSETITTYTIFTEVIPYWYEEMISSAFDKGYVFIDGSYYSISEYSSVPVGDVCCERLTLNVLATKTNTVAISCSKECIIEDLELPDCSLGELSYTDETVEGDCALGDISYTDLSFTVMASGIFLTPDMACETGGIEAPLYVSTLELTEGTQLYTDPNLENTFTTGDPAGTYYTQIDGVLFSLDLPSGKLIEALDCSCYILGITIELIENN